MRNQRRDSYKYIIILCLVFYIINYLLIVMGIVHTRHSVMHDAVVYVGVFVSYMWIYRRENLLCFELMAMPIGFIGLFFLDIISDFVPLLTRFYDVGNDLIKEKSATLQMIAWLTFILGGIIANNKGVKLYSIQKKAINYNAFLYFLTGVLLLLIFYDYVSGTFDTWFFYSNSDTMERDDRNEGLGHLTCLLVSASIVDIVRLKEMGIESLWDYIKKSNKVFLAEWAFISFMLIISGNRNEMLLIALPLVVSFSKCIKQISNKLLLIGAAAGVLLMVFVGSSRQKGVSAEEANFESANFFVDFAVLGYNCDYLVQYTDQHKPIYFKDLPGFVLSGIPVLGHRILDFVGYEPPVRSSYLATDSVGSKSGLGTSLIGDLYYGAGFLWVVLFMSCFGYTMSRLYHSDRNINKYHLLFYSYMVANAVYYVRSQWGFPIGTIIYCYIIFILGDILFKTGSKSSHILS